jgi:hypothetical protein
MYEGEEFVRVRDISSIMGCKRHILLQIRWRRMATQSYSIQTQNKRKGDYLPRQLHHQKHTELKWCSMCAEESSRRVCEEKEREWMLFPIETLALV